MCTHKLTPTILLGAGAVLEIGAPSTKSITQEITKPNKYLNYGTTDIYGKIPYYTAITKVYNRLKEKYPSEPNFEQIFHVLEMLESYNRVWSHECRNTNIYPVISPFIVPETNIVSHGEWDYLSSLVEQCKLDIMKMIYTYDSMYKNQQGNNKWYENFWNKFKGFDLFNLNYDTTIEQSLSTFCDGFVQSGDERFEKFDPKELLQNKCSYKVCHLHGCILYSAERYKNPNHDVYEYKFHDMYKWNDFESVKNMLQGSSSSNPSTQSGETIHTGSIITGLRKTDKLTFVPYNYYHHYLNTSILDNKSLLIVGYSFGDLYINDIIDRMNVLYGKDKRIVIITYWKYEQCEEYDGSVTRTFHGQEWNGTMNLNEKEYIFIKRMMHDDNFEMKFLDKTIPNQSSYTSKDGDVKLFVYGFKSAVEKHCDEIVNFLTNDNPFITPAHATKQSR